MIELHRGFGDNHKVKVHKGKLIDIGHYEVNLERTDFKETHTKKQIWILRPRYSNGDSISIIKN